MLILKPSIYFILFYFMSFALKNTKQKTKKQKTKKHWIYENTSKERNNTVMIT